MASTMVAYRVPFSGPANWIEDDLADYRETAEKTDEASKGLMKNLLGECENLVGCLTLGDEAFSFTNQLRKECEHLVVNAQTLPPPQDIFSGRYDPVHRGALFQTFYAILARMGVLAPQLSLERAELCLSPNYEVFEKTFRPEKYDEESRRTATEAAAKRKSEEAKNVNDGEDDGAVEEDEAPLEVN